MAAVRERIRSVLHTLGCLAVDPRSVDARSDLHALGLTSHACIMVMLALEDEFDVQFPDEALNKSTFASIDSIEEALARITT